MKKTLLFLSCLVASVGAFADSKSTDAAVFVNSKAACKFTSDTIRTTSKRYTILVDIRNDETYTIEDMVFENNNVNTTTDQDNNQKNYAVIGTQGSGTLILKNCTIKNPNKGVGVQVCKGITVKLYNCTVEVSGYRGYQSCALQAQGGEFAQIVVYSGTYVSNDGAALLICTSGGSITTYGGTFISNATKQPYLYNTGDNMYTGAVFCDGHATNNTGGKFYLEGGTFYGTIFNRNQGGSKVNITKGRFFTNEVRYGAGVLPAGQSTTAIGKYIAFDGWNYVGYGDEYQYKRASGTIYDEFETDKVKTPSRAISNVSYSTACFDRKPTSSNVKFYQPVTIIDTLVYIKEVALSDLEAGMPYLYKNAGSDSAYFTFKASETPVALSENNGLVGTIDGINYNVWKQRPISEYTDTLVGKYLLVANEWKLNSENGAYVLPNCAYINYDSTKPTLVMTTAEVPTACAKVAATNAQDGKVILNGKVYIRRNGQLFSVLGNAVE